MRRILTCSLVLSLVGVSGSYAEARKDTFVIVEGDVVRLSCDLEKLGKSTSYKDCAINNCHAKDNAAGLYDLKSGTLYIPLDQKTHKAPKEILKKLELEGSAVVTGSLFEQEDATPIIYVTSVK